MTTRPPKTIVNGPKLRPLARSQSCCWRLTRQPQRADTKLLIYGLFQKGRVLAQDRKRVQTSTTPRDRLAYFKRAEFWHRTGREFRHQRRLEIDFTSIALPVLSQRVCDFFFADDSPYAGDLG